VGRGEAVAAVHHLALRVAEVERALAFYAGVLGLTERRRFVEPDGRLRSAWLHAGPVVLMLEQRLRGAGPEAGSGHVLAFAVSDLAVWEARLATAGVAIDDRTSHTLFVRDPDGHRVGLSVFELEASLIS
jgi:catechol 2,3-dioxygenase-like lactoylglutathione lyase family enzyme